MRLKTLAALISAMAILAAALTTAASARNLRFSSLTKRVTWTAFELRGGFGTVRCPITLEGSLRSATIAKTAGAEIGSITGASFGTCSSGHMTVLRETLPWRVRYASFAGTLPNITSINTNIVNMAFQIEEAAFGITCLMMSSPTNPVTLTYNLAAGAVRSVTLGGSSIPCGSFTGAVGGTSSTNSALTITLI